MPNYRIDFFNRLAASTYEVLVYYSPVSLDSLTEKQSKYSWERQLGPFTRLLPGLDWQHCVLSVPISKDDIIVVCGAPRTLSTLVLLVKARFLGARTIWWGHFWSSTSKVWRHVLRLLLMRLSDAVLFYVDREIEEYRASRIGCTDNRPITALNNGLSIGPIIQHRRVYRGAERERALLFIGRLTTKAHLELVLMALARPALHDICLHVIGSGDKEIELRSLADMLSLKARVIWYGGTTDENKISAIANRCQAFVYPGEVGLSLIHSMAYGLPSILHGDRARQMPEFAAFEEGGTGCSFKAGDDSSLANAILMALSDMQRLDTWSRRCIEVTTYDYNTSSMANRFISFVGKL